MTGTTGLYPSATREILVPVPLSFVILRVLRGSPVFPARNSRLRNYVALDIPIRRSTIPKNSGEIHPFCWNFRGPSGFMTSKSPAPSRPSANMKPPCKHPRVQIVSRDEDSEFVECKECGEIFESSEFKDMNIEERAQDNEL